MAKKKKSSGDQPRLLDTPRILYPEPGSFSQFLFYGVLLLLGGVGSLGCFFSAFEIPVDLRFALPCGVICLLYSLALFLRKHPSWILALLGIGCWMAVVFLRFEDLVQGCAHTVNYVLTCYGDKLGAALPQLVTQSSRSSDITTQCTLFFCLFGFPYLFFLAWFLIRCKSGLGAFLLTGLLLLFPMVISLVPPVPYLGALLLFWLLLLLYSPSLGKRHRLLEDRKGFHASGGISARPAMLLLLPGAVLCMALTYLLFPQSSYERPQLVTDLKEGLTQGFGLEATLEGGMGNNNGRVNLSSLGARSYTGETVLRVKYDWESTQINWETMDKDDFAGTLSNLKKDYLKSFVGSVYTGGSWERLGSEDQARLEELLHGETSQTLLDRMYNTFSPDFSLSYQVTVENVGSNPRCIYAPYGLIGDSVNLDSMEYAADGFLQSTRFFSGTPDYTLEAWGIPNVARTYPERVQWIILSGYLGENSDTDSANSIFGLRSLVDLLNQSIYEDGKPLPSKQADLWTVPEEGLQFLSQEQKDLVQVVEGYNRFVYDTYTRLPAELKETLTAYLQEYFPTQLASAEEGFNSVPDVVKQIANTLAAQCTYTLNPPVTPQGEDFVEYFLLESHQGYCVHFATTAVALLRTLGIPARYAEGYAVPSGQEGWVEVPDYNAHAWVEVYLGGMGWVPMEVTPASQLAPAASDDAMPPQETPTPSPVPDASLSPSPSPTPSAAPQESATPAPGQSSSPSPSPMAGTTGSSDEKQGTGGMAWLAAGGIVAGILLLGTLALLIRRKAILRARQRSFRQSNRNQAVLALYGQILSLYQAGQRWIPQWKDTPPEELRQLALKARFSQHTLTAQEVQPFQEELDRMETRLRQSLSWKNRLWCQYGAVLF